jgi:DNA mismatch endonuclease (patch repair protein)
MTPLTRDHLTPIERSQLMARIKSRGNASTELTFLNLLRQNRVTGWRRHASIFGCPDFCFRECRTAVFIDGCFWHGCKLCCRTPASNSAFWNKKFEYNRQRDSLVKYELRRKGWRVVRIWEHELINGPKVIRKLKRILESA